MNQAQQIQVAGPKRGKGRPFGSKDIEPRLPKVPEAVRLSFTEKYHKHFESRATKLIKKAYEMAMKGDSRLMVDALNRIMGMARQSIEVSGPGGSPIRVQALATVALAQLSDSELQALEALNARLSPAPAAIDAQVIGPQALPESQPAQPIEAQEQPEPAPDLRPPE